MSIRLPAMNRHQQGPESREIKAGGGRTSLKAKIIRFAGKAALFRDGDALNSRGRRSSDFESRH